MNGHHFYNLNVPDHQWVAYKAAAERAGETVAGLFRLAGDRLLTPESLNKEFPLVSGDAVAWKLGGDK